MIRAVLALALVSCAAFGPIPEGLPHEQPRACFEQHTVSYNFCDVPLWTVDGYPCATCTGERACLTMGPIYCVGQLGCGDLRCRARAP